MRELTHYVDVLNAAVVTQSSDTMLGCYTSRPLEMHWCALGDLSAAFGGDGVFGLVLSALIFVIGYNVTDGDIVTPSVALLLLGGILVPSVPSQYQMLALTMMFAGGVGAVMKLLDKYVFGAPV